MALSHAACGPLFLPPPTQTRRVEPGLMGPAGRHPVEKDQEVPEGRSLTEARGQAVGGGRFGEGCARRQGRMGTLLRALWPSGTGHRAGEGGGTVMGQSFLREDAVVPLPS